MSEQETSFCAGFPLVEERALTDEERGSLARASARRNRRAVAWLAALAAGWAAVAFQFAAGPSAGRAVTLAVIGVIVLLIATPILIVLARDDFRLARSLRNGLRAGRIQRFEGVLNPAVALSDATAVRLLSKRALNVDVERPQSVEVVAGSGLLWRVNNVRPRRWLRARTTEVARAPDFAATAAEWVQPHTSPSGETVYLNRRDMTEAEQKELRGHLTRSLRYIPVWLFVHGYLIVLFISGAWRGAWILPALWLGIAVWMDLRLVRVVPFLLRLRRDAALGAVAIVRSDAEGEAAADGGAVSGSNLTAPTEILPRSGVVWSHDGHPAPWRKSQRG